MRNKIIRNKIIAYVLTVVILLLFALTLISQPTAIAYVRKVGGNNKKLYLDYNSNKVKKYCDNCNYCLYANRDLEHDTEHIFAQKWSNEKYINDYFNLRTANKYANNTGRGDLGFNNVEHIKANEIKDNGVLVGWKNDKYFEPLDEYKGDVARTLLYIYFNYGLSKKDIKGKFDLKTMVKWAKKDKVSEEEIAFADRVKENEHYDNLFIRNDKILDLFIFL